jgi:hypothetical protein
MSDFVLISAEKELSLHVKMLPKEYRDQRLRWNKDNDFKEKVPVSLFYFNGLTQKNEVFMEAFAQTILENYHEKFGLKVVEIVEEPKVVQPLVVQPGKTKGKKKHEEVV